MDNFGTETVEPKMARATLPRIMCAKDEYVHKQHDREVERGDKA